ncbi:hypothetical protein CCUS01_02129 [Colletotrichum cuscutae]|uniref:Uncharacterized protein n=1 Tax=Colletotrichum cuscutae TaxID=1209917 RepID=A0AAI9XJY0_9PEZI|nr:hypothetical protein CCUS01_02129 [Colletotrichum cuscutae]
MEATFTDWIRTRKSIEERKGKRVGMTVVSIISRLFHCAHRQEWGKTRQSATMTTHDGLLPIPSRCQGKPALPAFCLAQPSVEVATYRKVLPWCGKDSSACYKFVSWSMGVRMATSVQSLLCPAANSWGSGQGDDGLKRETKMTKEEWRRDSKKGRTIQGLAFPIFLSFGAEAMRKRREEVFSSTLKPPRHALKRGIRHEVDLGTRQFLFPQLRLPRERGLRHDALGVLGTVSSGFEGSATLKKKSQDFGRWDDVDSTSSYGTELAKKNVVALSSSGTEGGYWEAEMARSACISDKLTEPVALVLTYPPQIIHFPVNDVQNISLICGLTKSDPNSSSIIILTSYAQWQLSVSLGSCIIPITSAPTTARPATLGLEINTTHMGATVECDARPGKLTEPRTGDVRFGSAYFSIPPSPFDFGKRLAPTKSSSPATKSQVHPIWVIPDFEIASIKQPHQGFLRRLQNHMGLDPVQPNNNTEKLAFSGLSALLTEQYVPSISYKGANQLVIFSSLVRTSQAWFPTFRFEARQAEAGRNSLFSASVPRIFSQILFIFEMTTSIICCNSCDLGIDSSQMAYHDPTIHPQPELKSRSSVSHTSAYCIPVIVLPKLLRFFDAPRRGWRQTARSRRLPAGNRIKKSFHLPPQPRGSPDFRTELIHSDPLDSLRRRSPPEPHLTALRARFLGALCSHPLTFRPDSHPIFGNGKRTDFLSPRSKFGMSDFPCFTFFQFSPEILSSTDCTQLLSPVVLTRPAGNSSCYLVAGTTSATQYLSYKNGCLLEIGNRHEARSDIEGASEVGLGDYVTEITHHDNIQDLLFKYVSSICLIEFRLSSFPLIECFSLPSELLYVSAHTHSNQSNK